MENITAAAFTDAEQIAAAPAAPAEEWRLPSIEEELAELGLDSTPDGAAACDAAASWLLRQLGRAQLEKTRREQVHTRERELLLREQEMQLAPTMVRIADLERRIHALALEAKAHGWFGKAKSRKTSYGVYGTREKSDRIVIVDEKKAVAWAGEHKPAAVKVTEKVLISACSADLLEALRTSGDLPDAFEFVAGNAEPFATADVTVLAAEGGA